MTPQPTVGPDRLRTFTQASPELYAAAPACRAVHIQHPCLQDDTVQFRGYQANLARIASQKDTLVVLPTGMGKTIVALLVLADALHGGARRILLMAPTKPLVEQHAAFLQEVLQAPWSDRVHALTGNVPPSKRQDVYRQDAVVCATPQVIGNDLVGGNLPAGAWDWIVFDEAHRGVGEYPYAFIGRQMQKRSPDTRRLGLTASPGYDIKKIDEVRHNLGLHHVEIRTPDDPDVAEYVQALDVEWETLPLPENLARISRRLHDALAERVVFLKQHGALRSGIRRPSRKALLEVAQKLQSRARREADVPPEVYAALSVQAQAMKLLHAIELAETQGAESFRAFVDQMRKEATTAKASKATQRLANDPKVREAYEVAKHDVRENPKLGRTTVLVQERLEEDPESRVIVFANYRSTCDTLAQVLGDLPGVRPVVFVGQGKRKGREGLSQKKQQEVLQAFRDGTHNCLVATSVAEEGLDIPDTDLVIFYEPIPSEIRSIQRRGRTGRHREGRVLVLMTKGTQDEAAHWVARRKEQQMVKELHGLRAALGARPPVQDKAQTTLDAAAPPAPVPPEATSTASPAAGGLDRRPRILCDHREQPGGVVRHLHDLGTEIDARTLDVGDFVLSDRIAVERKEGKDFVDSLVDGRLFEQLKALQTYPRPLLVLEGDLYGHRNITPEALSGAIASLTMDLGIILLQTRDALETARLLHAVAKREQFRDSRKLALRPGRPGMSDDERLRHVLAGFPNIDGTLADRLLRHFGTLQRIFAADAAALAEVEGVGPATAEELRRVLQIAYTVTETVSRSA